MQPKRNFPDNAELVFSGILYDVYQWEQELYDGTTTTFEGLARRDGADVILVNEDGRIGINRQEQPGKGEFLACYGGGLDVDEEPLEGAKRELLEESGYVASEWEPFAAYHGFSKIRHTTHYFIARGIEKVAEQSLDGGEIITPMWIGFDEFTDFLIDEKLRVDPRLSLMFARARLDGSIEDLRRRIVGR